MMNEEVNDEFFTFFGDDGVPCPILYIGESTIDDVTGHCPKFRNEYIRRIGEGSIEKKYQTDG